MPEASTERAIGRLEGKLEEIVVSIRQNAEESSSGRRRIYEEQSGIKSDIAKLRNEINSIGEAMASFEGRMEKAEKVATEINVWRERLTGMRILAASLWLGVAAMCGAGLTLAAKWIAAKLGL